MSRPDRMSQLAQGLREDIVDALTDTVSDVIARLSPGARLRLVSFFHLLERPEAVLADLEVDPAGWLRLTLSSETPRPAG